MTTPLTMHPHLVRQAYGDLDPHCFGVRDSAPLLFYVVRGLNRALASDWAWDLYLPEASDEDGDIGAKYQAARDAGYYALVDFLRQHQAVEA